VHLNEGAVNAIKSIRPSRPRPSDSVFPREKTKDRFDNRSWFLPCLEEAKITGAVWHSNRHTFCSWLAMAGAAIKKIQEAAGQKTITMAARYSHLSPAHKLSVVERLVRTGTRQDCRKVGNQHAPEDYVVLLSQAYCE
jgi:integrase